MDDELFSSELDYQATLCIAECLHRSGILTDGEFLRAKVLLLEKYHPPIGILFSEFSWL